MFISAFKTNRVYLPFVMVVVTFLLWLDGFWFFTEISTPAKQTAPLYQLLVPFLEKYKFLNVLLGFVFLIIQAFIFNNIITSKNIVERHSYMPGFIYAVLMSSSFDMLSLHPALIANFFLIIVLDKIIDVYSEEKVYLEIFNVGLLTGLASLFYFPAIFFIALAIIALFVYFVASLRGIIATFLGFITPFLFVGIFYFMIDQLQLRYVEFINMYETFLVFSIEPNIFFRAYAIFFSFFVFIAVIKVYLFVIRDKPIRIRKRYSIVFYLLLISLVSILFITDKNLTHIGLINIPVAVIASSFFHSNRKRIWSEFLFTLLILFTLALKINRFY